ncbi:type II secretion system F family protein [Candidatus Woesearchaeota archaeon]|nr:type II secretion system F family protein [Candidatus Woesearchaeota archaeon]
MGFKAFKRKKKETKTEDAPKKSDKKEKTEEPKKLSPDAEKRIEAEREKIRAKLGIDAKEEKERKKEEKRKEKERKKEEKRKEKEEKKEKKSKHHKHLEKDLQKLKGLKDKRLFAKKKRFSLRGFVKLINLQEYLEKAGLDLDAKLIAKKIFKINIFFCLAITIIVIILSIIAGKGLGNLLIFLLGFWLTIFFFFLVIIWIAYLFYLDMKIFNRTKAVEAVFPDFLQLTSANISAGMPVDKALWYAVRPGFGVLAKEIEAVAKNTMAGEDLASALTSFANKYESKVIQRSVNLLLEGMIAGGEMADLLNKIALNIEETKILRKEMAASVTTYVIFITFATVLAAPVLFGLASQLLEIIREITQSMGSNIQASSSLFSFSFSSVAIKSNEFRIFAYLMLAISSLSSACIVSIIRKGRVKEGLVQIPVFIIISLILYTLSSVIIRGMFNAFL